MRAFASAVVGVLWTLGFPVSALAQCEFDGPAKAYRVQSWMIRSFAACPSVTFLAPNSQTGTGVPTCAPPYAHSEYSFNNDTDAGYCFFRVTAFLRTAPLCPPLGPDPCMLTTITLKCRGVLDPGGTTPTNASGFGLNIVTRYTFDDPDNGDMTVIDFPVQFPLTATDGLVTIGPQPQLLSFDTVGLPPCGELEILSAAVQDPDGNRFAVLGAGTR